MILNPISDALDAIKFFVISEDVTLGETVTFHLLSSYDCDTEIECQIEAMLFQETNEEYGCDFQSYTSYAIQNVPAKIISVKGLDLLPINTNTEFKLTIEQFKKLQSIVDEQAKEESV